MQIYDEYKLKHGAIAFVIKSKRNFIKITHGLKNPNLKNLIRNPRTSPTIIQRPLQRQNQHTLGQGGESDLHLISQRKQG